MNQFHVARHMPWLSAAVLATSLLAAQSAAAKDGGDLRGDWRGSSRIEGQRATSLTTLSLGSVDASDAEMRIEGGRTCTLKKGSYEAHGSGDSTIWQLTFKESSGGDSCAKIASGNFSLHADAKRHIEFEASYTDADGHAVKRVGMLSHYP